MVVTTREFKFIFMRGEVPEVMKLEALADSLLPEVGWEGTLLGRKGRCVWKHNDGIVIWMLEEEMAEMTPLAKIWWLGNAIITQDAVGGLREVCVCPTEEDRDWVAWSLAKLHGVGFGELRIPPPLRLKVEHDPVAEEPRHAVPETLTVSRDPAGFWQAEGPASAFAEESP